MSDEMERTPGMDLRVLINYFAQCSIIPADETNRKRLEALALVDRLEGIESNLTDELDK